MCCFSKSLQSKEQRTTNSAWSFGTAKEPRTLQCFTDCDYDIRVLYTKVHVLPLIDVDLWDDESGTDSCFFRVVQSAFHILPCTVTRCHRIHWQSWRSTEVDNNCGRLELQCRNCKRTITIWRRWWWWWRRQGRHRWGRWVNFIETILFWDHSAPVDCRRSHGR